jgi:hypothetical protein
MKKFLCAVVVILVAFFLMANMSVGGKIGSDCTFNGKKLYGKVQVVSSFPDFKVKVVTSFQDLNVQKVSSFPSDCGKWQMTDSFPDFKVQIVDSFEDFSIKYVDSFPGVN